MKNVVVLRLAARLSVGALALLPSLAAGQIRMDYLPGMVLGSSYDAITAEVKPACKAGDEKSSPALNSATFSWDEAASTDEIRKALNIDAAVAYKALNGNGASAKVSVLNTSFSSRSVVSIVARNRIVDHSVDLVSTQSTGQTDALAFRRKCGTHYLSSIIYGGELYAILSQTVTSEQEKDEFAAEAQATYAGLQADLSIKTALEKSRFAKSIKIQGNVSGGDAKIFMDPEELRKTFISFRASVAKDGAVPIEVVFTPYQGLSDVDEDKLDAINDAFVKLASIRDFRSELMAIQRGPQFYLVDPKSVAREALLIDKQATALDARVRKSMRKCAAKSSNASKACDFSNVAVAPAGEASGLPRMYKSSCLAPFQPPAYGAEFAGIPRVFGDNATGGNDVVRIATAYTGTMGQPLLQDTTVTIQETTTGDTMYELTLQRSLLDPVQRAGCGLAGTVTLPKVSGTVALGDPENDYRKLTFNTAYVDSAECRSNKFGSDDGYVGCQSIAFKPIDLPMIHAETIGKSSLPAMSFPGWLQAASANQLR